MREQRGNCEYLKDELLRRRKTDMMREKREAERGLSGGEGKVAVAPGV